MNIFCMRFVRVFANVGMCVTRRVAASLRSRVNVDGLNYGFLDKSDSD